jgi:peptide/nickel transport system substrate-binding protein
MLVMGMRIDDLITLDPAEVFELSGGEISANIYDRIMMFEPEDLTTLVGGVVESWQISDDGKTITFKMRGGLSFHSGNPVRAQDAVYSLQRVVKLNKTPAFILTQFGWSADNVDDLIKVIDDQNFSITIVEDFSPGLVLNALSAGVGSVVDQKLVEENAVDGDMGYAWLKDKSAGSGAFSLQEWKSNETVTLNANPKYRHGEPAMQRVILRHLPEPAAQRLLLEEGDIDIARTLTPDQIAGLEGNDDITVELHPKATLIYMAANTTHEALGKPQVQEALHYLIDYKGMADSFLKGQFSIHQSFWPAGLWASADDKPYALDIERGKALLAAAGHGDGFSVTIDSLNTSPFMEIAQSLQQTLGQAGIDAEIVPQSGSAADRRSRLAQCLGRSGHHGAGRGRSQRDRPGSPGGALFGPPAVAPAGLAVCHHVPAERTAGKAQERERLRFRVELRPGVLPQRDQVGTAAASRWLSPV